MFRPFFELFRLPKRLLQLFQIIKHHQKSLAALETKVGTLEAQLKEQKDWNEHLLRWQIRLEQQVERAGIKKP